MKLEKCIEHVLFIRPDSSVCIPALRSPPVEHAIRMLKRDWAMVLGGEMRASPKIGDQAALVIRHANDTDGLENRPEAFAFRFRGSGDRAPSMEIIGIDDLGLVYGILEFSQRFLGIQPFWFWMDQTVVIKESLRIPAIDYDAPPPAVRFRGWFVNDEVCLIGWKKEYPPTREIWEPVFEALLRCGGNMVLPGTDLPKTGVHADVAAEMGLWITHHHAEPLGAEMFLRAYPGRQASYQKEPELFEALWQEAIDKQKHRNTLWVLAFRGQGDKPFWIEDPSFDTAEKRGAMISKVVRRQYNMISASVTQPVCCVALYGEIGELYMAGHVDLPADVIKVWADNGYGKMVSRRRGVTNLRVPALPKPNDEGKHGVYYHVTFHDLQASNHLTMFPGPAEFIADELKSAFDARADEYLLVNCGNIRQHVYQLDLCRELWAKGHRAEKDHLARFLANYFKSGLNQLRSLYEAYPQAAIHYGPHKDDWAGDEFYHHSAREIIGHWLRGDDETPEERLVWATGERPFSEQVRWFGAKAFDGMTTWAQWLANCDQVVSILNADDAQRADDHLRFHGILHHTGSCGLHHLSRAYAAYRERRYAHAFVWASEALWSYRVGLQQLDAAEHDKWGDFYRADWLTNIASTVRNVETLRQWLRMHGDSPDFFLWYKEFLMPETEKHIYLENTHRNPLPDDELARLLKAHFGKTDVES